ncbi:MAG: hypothetical protein V1784_12895, partial [bacterium]
PFRCSQICGVVVANFFLEIFLALVFSNDRIDEMGGMIEAIRSGWVGAEIVKADLTVGEIIGTIREIWGLHYDPLEIIQSPFPKKTA